MRITLIFPEPLKVMDQKKYFSKEKKGFTWLKNCWLEVERNHISEGYSAKKSMLFNNTCFKYFY